MKEKPDKTLSKEDLRRVLGEAPALSPVPEAEHVEQFRKDYWDWLGKLKRIAG